MSTYDGHDIRRMARIFGALSNPHRLRLFIRLLSCCGPGTAACPPAEECPCVGDLGQDLEIAPSTVSHHLKELHHAGLIGMERRGKTVACWVDAEALRAIAAFLDAGRV